MKTLMLIAAFVSLASGCATTATPGTTVAARGPLSGLVQPSPAATYAGIERISSSFREGR